MCRTNINFPTLIGAVGGCYQGGRRKFYISLAHSKLMKIWLLKGPNCDESGFFLFFFPFIYCLGPRLRCLDNPIWVAFFLKLFLTSFRHFFETNHPNRVVQAGKRLLPCYSLRLDPNFNQRYDGYCMHLYSIPFPLTSTKQPITLGMVPAPLLK